MAGTAGTHSAAAHARTDQGAGQTRAQSQAIRKGAREVMDEKPLPAQRMEHATTKLQDAMSALKLAAEELHIVDAEMIGSDANRRVTVEASKEDPIKVSDDIESHRMQAAEIAGLAAEVAKTAKVVKGKAAFLGQALGSVYSSELLEGDRAREKAKDKQAKLFPPGDHDA